MNEAQAVKYRLYFSSSLSHSLSLAFGIQFFCVFHVIIIYDHVSLTFHQAMYKFHFCRCCRICTH